MDAKLPVKKFPFWWLLITIPAGIHFFLLYRYSVNAPRLDDFSDGFGFLTHFYQTDSLQEKVDWFFSRYQNHRWGFLHAIYAAYHCIDFRSANFLSMPWLLLLLWLWHRATHNTPYHAALLICASFLIFNLHSWTGMFWITASLAAFPSIPLALLAFMLAMYREAWALISAIAISLLATFTNGNGVFIWLLVIGHLIFLQIKSPDHRRWFFIAVWIVIAIPTLSAFFSDWIFHPVNTQEDRVAGFAQKLLENPLLFIKGLFATIGSNLIYYPKQDTDWQVILAIAMGITESIAMMWLLLTGALRKNPPLLLLTLYIGGTMAAIAASRVLFIGLHQAFQGHYKLYNSMFLLLLCTAWLDKYYSAKKNTANTFIYAATGASIFLYLASLVIFIPAVDHYHRELVSDTKNWLYTNKLTRGESQLFVKQPNQKLLTAVAGGFYNPWTLLNDQEIPRDIIYTGHCPTALLAVPAKLQSQQRALAVHIEATLPARTEKFCLQGSQQAIYFARPASDNSTDIDNNITLWVPRNSEVTDDAGPWTLYALP